MPAIILRKFVFIGKNIINFVVVFIGKAKYVVFGHNGVDYGSNKNIVRRLGCVLPIRPYSRAHTNPSFFFVQTNLKTSSNGCSTSSDEQSFHGELQNYKAFGFDLVAGKPDIIPSYSYVQMNTSTPKKKDEDKLQELERKVEEMKEVLQLLLERSNMSTVSLGCSDYGPLSGGRSSLPPFSARSSLPPLPPPPPPPLPPPPTPFAESVARKKVVSCSVNMGDVEKNEKLPHVALAEIAKCISSVKLRHVERSPGGRPIRQPPLQEDSETVLHAVLKRRNAAMLNITPESSVECHPEGFSESDSSLDYC